MKKNNTNLLFVYGSLMKGLQTPISHLLESNNTFLGEATMKGKLYDIGHYPAAVYDEKADSKIYGHIFELVHNSDILKRLDAYEAVGERFDQYNEYIRDIKPIRFKDQIVQCWVYLYNLNTDKFPIIKSGNYLENLKTNKKHRDFLKSV